MKTNDSEEHEDKDEKHSHIEEVRQRINQGLYLFLYAYRTWRVRYLLGRELAPLRGRRTLIVLKALSYLVAVPTMMSKSLSKVSLYELTRRERLRNQPCSKGFLDTRFDDPQSPKQGSWGGPPLCISMWKWYSWCRWSCCAQWVSPGPCSHIKSGLSSW